jgi:hypothetical protein
MTRKFKEIEVPNMEGGLTEKQRDMLRVQVADRLNYVGETVAEINGEVQRLDKEIYGDGESEGLKSKVFSNSRWVNIIVKSLIIAGIGGLLGWGTISAVGGI